MRHYLFASILLAILITGCQKETNQSDVKEASAAQITPENTSSAEPISRKGNSYRAALLLDAMKGLRYENDEVTVHQLEAAQVLRGLEGAQAATEFQRGVELLNKNHIIESIRFHTHAVLLEPDNTEFYTGLGRALLVKRKQPQARAALNTALELDETNVDA